MTQPASSTPRTGAASALRPVSAPNTARPTVLFTGGRLTQASGPDNHEAVVGLNLLAARTTRWKCSVTPLTARGMPALN